MNFDKNQRVCVAIRLFTMHKRRASLDRSWTEPKSIPCTRALSIYCNIKGSRFVFYNTDTDTQSVDYTAVSHPKPAAVSGRLLRSTLRHC